MGRKDSHDGFRTEKIPKEDEVEDYDPRNGPACTIANFRPDLTGVPSTPWNASVIAIFVNHYCGMHPGISRKDVEEHFKGHLKYLCERYKLTLQGAAEVRRRQKLANRSERQRNVSAYLLLTPRPHSILWIAVDPTPRCRVPVSRHPGAHSYAPGSWAARYELG